MLRLGDRAIGPIGPIVLNRGGAVLPVILPGPKQGDAQAAGRAPWAHLAHGANGSGPLLIFDF